MDHIEQLLIDVKEGLEREIRGGFARMESRFDTQATRLDRQDGLLNAGSRWSSRMDS